MSFLNTFLNSVSKRLQIGGTEILSSSFMASDKNRLAVCIIIAPIASYLLFVTMEIMIRPGEVSLEEDRSLTLRNFTADKSDLDVRARPRKAKKIDDSEKPPPPPKLVASRQKLDLPTPQLEGAVPDIDIDQISSIDVGAVAVDDRNAQPIRPPLCQFPSRAASRGIEGRCEVSLNVGLRGQPYGVKAQCDHPIFVREAERCVGKTEFAPKVSRGKAVERRNVVYPLEFLLAK